MTRENFMNGLMGVTVLAALLTGYNALVAKKGTMSPTSKLSAYLNLAQAKQEVAGDEDKVVGTDNGSAAVVEQSVGTMSEGEADVAATPSQDVAVTDAQPTQTTTIPAQATTTGALSREASTYTIKDGDTLGCIAEKYYGSYENWPAIAAANPKTEGYQEYRLFVGSVLALPAVSAESAKPASALCN